MEHNIVGEFATRRDAELAVEHLVQEMHIERADIFIRASGAANSAGTEKAGADVESGHPGVRTEGTPELKGPIEVSVDYHGEEIRKLVTTLKSAGAVHVELR